jgi:predicted cupin superfamily sugar epimerase
MTDEKTKLTVANLVGLCEMQPHPEGGYFRETYRSQGAIFSSSDQSKFQGERTFSTGIYFLLPSGSKSRLHRITSDEMWHFYLGGPMTLVQISPEGEMTKVILGQDLMAGQRVQYTVPAGCWFGGYPNPGTDYSFVGCTVSPGFEFQDFEMGNRNELLSLYPHAKDVIYDLT